MLRTATRFFALSAIVALAAACGPNDAGPPDSMTPTDTGGIDAPTDMGTVPDVPAPIDGGTG